jgi:hypothetical protein
MPAPTSKRAGVEPPDGALFPSQVLARNLGALRRLEGRDQVVIAERMNALGHPWTRQTVSEVERELRNVTIDELISLALVYLRTVDQLLEPRMDQLLGPVTMRPKPTPPRVALVRDPDPQRMADWTIAPDDFGAIVCGHTTTEADVTWDNLGQLKELTFSDSEREH